MNRVRTPTKPRKRSSADRTSSSRSGSKRGSLRRVAKMQCDRCGNGSSRLTAVASALPAASNAIGGEASELRLLFSSPLRTSRRFGMVGKRVQFDEVTWEAIQAVMRDAGMSFQGIADEAFSDVLKKRKQPVGLIASLKERVLA